MKRNNLIFDIGHPGHVHLFRNLINELEKLGCNTTIYCRNSKIILELLDNYKLNYKPVFLKTHNAIIRFLSTLCRIITNKIISQPHSDIGLGVSLSLPILSKISKMQIISFDDDDSFITPFYASMTRLADTLLTPSALADDKRGRNRILYSGYHELAYLHPNWFKPDPAVLLKLGVENGQIFFIFRFNSFKAHHDIGENGLSFSQKMLLIEHFKKFGKIFISSESEIDEQFASYSLPINISEIHSALYYATLFIGDSQTMTTEAAVLGTPALKCNTFAGRLSVPNELELKYGLCFSFQPKNFKDLLRKANELIEMSDLKSEWQKRRLNMLNDNIDVTSFFIWFVSNYPQSVEVLKSDSNFQRKFQ